MIRDGSESGDAPLTSVARLQSIIHQLDLLSREMASSVPVAGTLADRDQVADDLRRLARGLLWQRAIVAETFESAEFVNPVSNMMLFLYAAGVNATSSAGDCCRAAGVPRTTALRWIGFLEQRNLVVSTADPADRRRTFVALTDIGRSTIQRCLSAIAEAPGGGPPML